MARFGSPAKQARGIINTLRKDRIIPSIRSGYNYLERLTMVGKNAAEWGLPRLRDMTPDDCVAYLDRRGQEVGQSTLNQERLALQMTLQHVSYHLGTDEKLPVIKSELAEAQSSRFYTPEQVDLVKSHMTEKHQLNVDIAYAAGLRAADLLAITRLDEKNPQTRPSNDEKFLGRAGERYSVTSKGGLIREIRLPVELARQLESHRLDTPMKVIDRGVVHWSHYDVRGGQRFSNAFSAASNRALGWSRGAHGLRHSYAQERMRELGRHGVTYDRALQTVSQELGHFRTEITLVYLR